MSKTHFFEHFCNGNSIQALEKKSTLKNNDFHLHSTTHAIFYIENENTTTIFQKGKIDTTSWPFFNHEFE